MHGWLHRIGVLVLAAVALGASCGQIGLSILPGVVNDPNNRTLRREIFRFATDQLCPELLNRSIPLKLRDEDPSIGRFFPTRCSVHELANEKNLFVQFSGHGYAWTNVTGRMGFEATAAVEYEHDFLMDGATMYVYFRQRHIQESAFTPLGVERRGGAAGVASLLGNDLDAIAAQVGKRVLDSQLARGFTVARQSDGQASFALGVMERGDKPFAPFDRGRSDWPLLANDRLELHHEQLDLVGPFTIEDDGQALWLTALVEGAPAVDVLVITKPMGDPWLAAYEREPVPPPLPQAMIEDVLIAAAPLPGPPPTPYRRPLPLPPGRYYIAFDNSSIGGRTTPAGQPHDDRAALVSYAVQLGDKP